ncbi:hypothetical protein AOLI_G00261850 [Acnodon oligacanthus]
MMKEKDSCTEGMRTKADSMREVKNEMMVMKEEILREKLMEEKRNQRMEDERRKKDKKISSKEQKALEERSVLLPGTEDISEGLKVKLHAFV